VRRAYRSPSACIDSTLATVIGASHLMHRGSREAGGCGLRLFPMAPFPPRRHPVSGRVGQSTDNANWIRSLLENWRTLTVATVDAVLVVAVDADRSDGGLSGWMEERCEWSLPSGPILFLGKAVQKFL